MSRSSSLFRLGVLKLSGLAQSSALRLAGGSRRAPRDGNLLCRPWVRGSNRSQLIRTLRAVIHTQRRIGPRASQSPAFALRAVRTMSARLG